MIDRPLTPDERHRLARAPIAVRVIGHSRCWGGTNRYTSTLGRGRRALESDDENPSISEYEPPDDKE